MLELHALVALFRRRWITVLGVALVSLAAAFAFGTVTPATYTADARAFVSVQGTDTVGDLLQGSSFARQQTASYAELANSPLVLDQVIADLGLPTTSAQLADLVTGSAEESTTLLTVTVTGGDAQETADIANAAAEQLDQAVQTVNATEGGGSDATITLVRPATTPESPTSPNLRYNLVIGLVLGLALGAAVALARDLLDGRVKDVLDLRRSTSAPVLGSVARSPRATGTPAAGRPHGGRRTDDFRRLRTSVQAVPDLATPKSKVLAVVSPTDGDGKTTAAVNLAVSLAETGARVTLVDGNFRAPGVAVALGIEATAGWDAVLAGERGLDEVVVRTEGTLSVLPAGSLAGDPAELLSRPVTTESLHELGSASEWVVIDTPSLLTASDAAILARLVDGVILVVDIGTSRHRDVSRATELLASVGARVLGVVANRA